MELNAEQKEAVAIPHAYTNGDRIRHLQTDTVYFVLVSPSEFVKIEQTGEPAYGYARVGEPVGLDNPMWFRSQAEVEDPARFEWLQNPENNPEWVKARDVDYKRFYTLFNDHFQPLIEALDVAERTDKKVAELIVPQLVKFANDNFGATHEVIISEPWIAMGTGKGGVVAFIADHGKGYKHEVTMLFQTAADRPVDMPKMTQLEEVTAHHVEGGLANLPIFAMRPTDGQADNPNSWNYYDIHGFVTAGFGGRAQREGCALAFQDGPIQEVGPTGVSIEALLAISLHRLQKLNDGEFECEENTLAIAHLTEALGQLKQRTARRIAEGVHNSHKA